MSNHTSSADSLVLYGQTFQSRLLLGTSRYPFARRAGSRRSARQARHGHRLAAPPGQQCCRSG